MREFDLKNTYFNFRGRIGRQQFWLFYVLPMFFLSGLMQASVDFYEFNPVVQFILFFINIIFIICLIAGYIKRLHDRGKSAWWLLLILIPVIGTIYWIIDLGILKGEDEPNRYGPPAVTNKDVINA